MDRIIPLMLMVRDLTDTLDDPRLRNIKLSINQLDKEINYERKRDKYQKLLNRLYSRYELSLVNTEFTLFISNYLGNKLRIKAKKRFEILKFSAPLIEGMIIYKISGDISLYSRIINELISSKEIING